jgi:hypothetical protein
MTKLERIKKDENFKKTLLDFYGRDKELLSFFTYKEVLKNKLSRIKS